MCKNLNDIRVVKVRKSCFYKRLFFRKRKFKKEGKKCSKVETFLRKKTTKKFFDSKNLKSDQVFKKF